MAEDHALCIARQAGWRPDGTDGGHTLGVRDWPDVREGTTHPRRTLGASARFSSHGESC
jgi:hypothetical protein